jgi:phosphate transport system permease protein
MIEEGTAELAQPALRSAWPLSRRRRRDIHAGDRRFHRLLQGAAWVVVLLLAAIALQILQLSWPALDKFGLAFLHQQGWNPVSERFGALAFIFGTVVSSFLALAISAPVSVGVALFLNELAPRRLAAALGFLVEMLAAIPSVIYGLWGIFVLAPWLRTTVEPALGSTLGFLPLFSGPPYGVGMLAAGIVLAIMVTPTISAICREVFRAVPLSQREAALALGSTRWEMIRMSVLGSSHSGVLGAVILGLGRALGETMAVTMVIGNRPEIAASLFAPGQTMASVIANEYAEATSDMHLAALATVGLLLFVVSFVMNTLARLLIWRLRAGKAAR